MSAEPALARERRVVVVTGGGGGIGAAIAEDLGRLGAFVVTVDPLVSVDGSALLPAPEETTAGRIIAAGGAAQASSASVTDRGAIGALFADLVDTYGRVDAVVNVAGITRPTGFATGTEEDWEAVLSVHLDGYLNVLGAALPIMAAAGRGHILGVTSGSGWRAADAGAYSCAKRAVASLTWQIGRAAPPGVIVNAISPIAVTRMVTAALARAGEGRRASGTGGGSAASSATGGLSLGSMPQPEQLGPFGSYLVDPALEWCRGQVFFAGGSEVAVVQPPQLVEVIRTSDAPSVPHVLRETAAALVAAETRQTTGGGSNPRFAAMFDDAATEPSGAVDVRDESSPTNDVDQAQDDVAVAVFSDDPALGPALVARLEAGGMAAALISLADVRPGFDGAAAALASARAVLGALDAVIVAGLDVALTSGSPTPASSAEGSGAWSTVLAESAGLVGQIHADAAWARAVADRAATDERPIRLISLVAAATSGGRSRAQAAAQLSRAARRATADRVSAVAVSLEGADPATVAELAVHLVATDAGVELSGAELVAGDGWIGLRSHPRPTGTLVVGPPPLPAWFDDALRSVVGGSGTTP